MGNKLILALFLILSSAGTCLAQSTMTYLLVVPPSATTPGSGCACDGACGQPDSTWLTAGTYASPDDCNAAISMAVLTVTDGSGNTSTNDCSQTAQCVPGPPPQ
jgi:hypothetical protein